MIAFFKRIFSATPLSLLPDLDVYTIQNRPRRNVVVEQKKATEGTVFNGKEWRDEWNQDGTLTSQQVGTNVPASPSLVVLDAYDSAYLDDVIGQEWRRDETRAKVMKWHWLREESAQRIQEAHTANGKLERGYSERTAAQFVKAFYSADDKRERDNKPRQRIAPTSPPPNVFAWD